MANAAEETAARRHFLQYVRNGLLELENPDYLILARLANEELRIAEDRILLPTAEDISRMRGRIETFLAEEDYGSLLQKFGGELNNFFNFANDRMKLGDHLAEWCAEIASREPDSRANIRIENYIDCEGLPAEFEYVTDYTDPGNVGFLPPGENRLMQQGCQLSLTIFRTCNRGWGVRADERILRGTFIGEFVGVLLTANEAVRRHSINSAHMFDLRPIRNEGNEYTVDAAQYGNFTRFLNHSCDPNLRVNYAYIDNHNPAAPRLAFFAKRDIENGEELTFDYNNMQKVDGNGSLTPNELPLRSC